MQPTASPALLTLVLLVLPLAPATGADWFAPYAWQNRHILVFAPARDDPRFQALRREMRLLEDAVIERKLLLWELVGEQTVRINGHETDVDEEALRARFRVPPGRFLVILVGYDGAEKLRQDTVDLGQIFGAVDRMPLRRLEMGVAD